MYQNILVPLDGSENSEHILDHVKAIATGCNVPNVTILNVIEPMYYDPALVNMAGGAMQEVRKAGEDVGNNYVRRICDGLKKEGINAIGVVQYGKAAEIALTYAEANNIDLIMLCTHGRSGVSRWVFGSVAEKIIQHSTKPVFLLSLRNT